jgi:hypothetical protein
MSKDTQNWPKSADKEQNRARILRLLDTGPKRFTDLLKETGFSPRGLTTMLKDLEGAHKIEKTRLQNGRESYRATKSGESWLMKYVGIVALANFLRDEGGKYYEHHSGINTVMTNIDLTWGIQVDMLVGKNLENPITSDTAHKLERLLYKQIKEDIKNKKIHLDQSKKGDILLGFMINYEDLVKSIQENSLEYLDNMSKQEWDLYDRKDNETITKKEFDELQTKLREKTKKKLEKLK